MTNEEESAADRLEKALKQNEEVRCAPQDLTPEQKRMALLLERAARLPPRERKQVFVEAALPLLASRVGVAAGRRPAPLPESRVVGSGRTSVIFDPKPSKESIDWDTWSSIPALPLWMAIALSLELNPGPLLQNPLSIVMRNRHRAARVFGEKFATRMDIALLNLNRGGALVSAHEPTAMGAIVTINGFLRFALGLAKPWVLPEKFPGRSMELVRDVVDEPNDACIATVESPSERQSRRLADFRKRGGRMRRAGTGWQQTGERGSLAALASKEAQDRRPMADKKNVRDDLIAAIEAEAARIGGALGERSGS